MTTIAVIEDDLPIGNLLQEVLEKQGYAVRRAYSGTEALYLLEREKPDLALLDLMLPGLSGEEVLPHLAGVPVIVLSAKAGVEDKVRLLLGGAADYLTKPFQIPELLARIQVRLRERETARSPVLRWENLELDETSRQAAVEGVPVHLTRTEYALLKLLLEHQGRAVAKSVILDSISRDTPDCTESSLKQHVSNLRKKLRDAGAGDCIQSVWGIGFLLGEPKS
ncbi:MAG TPA: response regulator transcription factor [Candidatus Acutalibacter pullistercoris]|uniref:Stage 0 sporulation protein A homolog n=1 Tax=Candidatus Acutalibacter pullistercoris TaxID=2838418 RepID=A0A9D1YEE9_9FIRM|nr:response regulator transcription factor [Candidatus Acutalibacter pullistercoris]